MLVNKKTQSKKETKKEDILTYRRANSSIPNYLIKVCVCYLWVLGFDRL